MRAKTSILVNQSCLPYFWYRTPHYNKNFMVFLKRRRRKKRSGFEFYKKSLNNLWNLPFTDSEWKKIMLILSHSIMRPKWKKKWTRWWCEGFSFKVTVEKMRHGMKNAINKQRRNNNDLTVLWKMCWSIRQGSKINMHGRGIFFLKCHFNALLLEIYSASLVSIIYLIDVVFL